jgi:methylated-DNA-[protein]-cysteine S-methyltransferase
LDAYFAHDKPAVEDLPLAPEGSEFRQMVWRILISIPYGATMTYGQIAQTIARQTSESNAAGKADRPRVAAQAVGGAVGHNPISIIIPCHRVIGADGSLTGYAGGIQKKIWLLEHEKTDMTQLFVPSRGTAL